MPQRTDFTAIDCSIARTMAILGEPWTPLVLRDLFIGITRFEQIRAHLGLSRNVLTERLAQLADAEVVEKRPYSDRPLRHDYLLTPKGWELCDLLLAITAWGDRWTTGADGPPATIRHTTCGQLTEALLTCAHCARPLHASEVQVVPRGEPVVAAG